MLEILNKIRRRLVSKLILTVGLFFLVSVATWDYFNVSYQKEKVMQNIVSSTDRLTATIRPRAAATSTRTCSWTNCTGSWTVAR